MTYQGKARNGHAPAPQVKAYLGTACNHACGRRISLRALALVLFSMLYLAVR